MARIVYAMMQSLDGYVAAPEGFEALPMPGAVLHRHFNDHMRRVSASLYGRRIYDVMRYWDDDHPDHDDVSLDFESAWRATPKFVVSRTLKSVGPNATLVDGDLETFVRSLKAGQEGEIEVAGPELAGHLTQLGLIDEYRLYLRPVVLGGGKPFFSVPLPRLKFLSSRQIDEDTICVSYSPA